MYAFLRKKRKLKFILFLTYIVLIGTLMIPINYHISAPGNLSPLNNKVIVDNHENSYDISTVYVITLPKVTLFQALISHFDGYLDLNKNKKSDISTTDSYKSGQVSEELSFQYAIIQAYEAAAKINANISINYELKGYILSYKSAYQKDIEIGDIITKIDGVSFLNVDYNTFLKPLKEKNVVSVEIMRDNQAKDLVLTKNDINQNYGLYIEPFYNITATPSYSTTYKDDFIGGPSGGLMQSLFIYCTLLDINLSGLKIAGTGTIDAHGNVGEIGGIKQKIVTAYRNKEIDVFYVGTSNYQDAKKVYEQLKRPSFSLVEVGEFSEVITDLLQRI